MVTIFKLLLFKVMTRVEKQTMPENTMKMNYAVDLFYNCREYTI